MDLILRVEHKAGTWSANGMIPEDSHDWYQNAAKVSQPVPRHGEIKEALASPKADVRLRCAAFPCAIPALVVSRHASLTPLRSPEDNV